MDDCIQGRQGDHMPHLGHEIAAKVSWVFSMKAGMSFYKALPYALTHSIWGGGAVQV